MVVDSTKTSLEPEIALVQKVVVIGASTGGPSALPQVLEPLPADFPLTIFVGQHMSHEFIESFVHNLRTEIRMPISMAADSEIIVANHIYVAPSGGDMKILIDQLGHRQILLTEPSTTLQPSIDVLMASVATVYGAATLGVILTGMGADGLEGMRAIKAVGGRTVVQDEATSAVYGMAQAVNDEHLADSVLSLQVLAGALLNWSKS